MIDSFSLKDVGLSESSDGIVEIRQKYFHLFWIPVFATGKDWLVHKASGTYDLSDKDISHIIYQTGNPKTPWYTFAVPIVCGGFAIIAIIGSLFDL